MPRFSAEEIRRYGRQILLREVGGHGQERLRAARIRLDGSGPILTIAARYLLRAGIGHLSIRVPSQAEASALSLTLADDRPGDAPLDVSPDTRMDTRPGVYAVLDGGRTVWAGCQGAAGEILIGCPCQPCSIFGSSSSTGSSSSAGSSAGDGDPLAGPLLGAQLALVVLRLVLQMDLAPPGGARLRVGLDPAFVGAQDGPAWTPLADCTCAAPPPAASCMPS